MPGRCCYGGFCCCCRGGWWWGFIRAWWRCRENADDPAAEDRHGHDGLGRADRRDRRHHVRPCLSEGDVAPSGMKRCWLAVLPLAIAIVAWSWLPGGEHGAPLAPPPMVSQADMAVLSR